MLFHYYLWKWSILNILKWFWGKPRKNLWIETCQSITAYLFYEREDWAIASFVHIWEFSFFSKICPVLQMLMFVFSIWGPLAILKLDIWLNVLNHFRMLHLFFYPGVNTWISLALVQKFRTYRAVNFKNIWAFLCVCIYMCMYELLGLCYYLSLMEKILLALCWRCVLTYTAN